LSEALVIIDGDGRYIDGNVPALDILGVSLEELRAATSATFAEAPVDEAQSQAFREAWEAAGRPDITGETTVRRPDGSHVRVRFAITPRADGTYAATFQSVPDSPSHLVALRTIGAVISA